jgi:hypothetical protein
LLPTLPLTQIAETLVTQLGALRTAIIAADLPAIPPIVAALNTALDQYDALKPTILTTLAPDVDGLAAHLATWDAELDGRMGYVESFLQPEVGLKVLEQITAPLQDPAVTSVISEFGSELNTIVAWLQALLNKIDLTVLQAPLTEAADAARAVVDEFDAALVNVTLEVQSLFNEVNALVDQVDVAALRTQFETAINDFRTQLTTELTGVFEPVRQAITDVVGEIDTAVDSFDPAQVQAAVEDAIDAIAGVLENPSVLSAVESIRQGIDAIAQQLAAISFAPLTDEVIGQIEDVGQAIQEVTADVNPAIKEALGVALEVIPTDLTPLTDPLISELATLIESGPVALLNEVKDLPQQVLDRVREFDPAAAVGGVLAPPFNALLDEMEAFAPSQLLTPVRDAFETLKTRLKQSANPGQFLQPLEGPFNDLLGALDVLNPAQVTEPLDQAIQSVIASVIDALPIQEIFDQFDAAMDEVQKAIGYATDLKSSLDRLAAAMAAFTDPAGQLNAWATPILAKIDAIGDTAPIQTALTGITAAVDALKAAGVTTRLTATLTPLQTPLTTLNPQARLTAIVQAFSAISTASVNALPDSPEKTAAQAVLTRLTPMSPAFNGAYQKMVSLAGALTQATSATTTLLGTWDVTYHAPTSTLTTLRSLQGTPANLKAWVQTALNAQFITPLANIFGALTLAGQIAARMATELGHIITDMQAKITSLLLGPNSITAIRNAMQALIDRIQALNLNFLTQNLQALFEQVKDKFEVFSPVALRAIVDDAFNDMVDTLGLPLVLPQSQVDALDAIYGEVLEKLRALTPDQLLQSLTPVYLDRVVPLVEALDVTVLLNVIIERLLSLDEELRGEIGRVNASFQALLQSISAAGVGSGASVGI